MCGSACPVLWPHKEGTSKRGRRDCGAMARCFWAKGKADRSLRRVALNFESEPKASYDLVGLHVDQIGAVKIIELVSRNIEHAAQRYIADVGA